MRPQALLRGREVIFLETMLVRYLGVRNKDGDTFFTFCWSSGFVFFLYFLEK